MREHALPPGAGSTIGGYLLEAQLGAGAMGAVFRARRDEGPRVAIKILHGEALTRKDLRSRFEREAAALAALTHPNIIGVVEFGAFDGTLCLVMELLDGESLEDLITREHLSPERAVEVADKILAGLAHAHAHGILHRDLKPANVFLARQPDGTSCVKLLDFGLAKFIDHETWGPKTLLTAKGAVMGTPAYMAPEQIFGAAVDARTDVYGAGVVLFELLTGTWPFVAEDTTGIFRAHAVDAIPTIASARPELSVRPELDAVIQRALAKKPADRFADGREMRVALGRVPRPVASVVG